MDAIWHFHHETWDEPWSSDDFPAGESEKETDQRLRYLSSKPWWKNTKNEVVQFLHKELTSQWPWGYTIYRTIYTPESDQHWDAFLDAISKNTYAGLGSDLHDNEPSRIFKEGYRPLVFDEPAQFNGATLDEIRKHFRAFRDGDTNGNQEVRFRWCLVIDEGALQSFIRHSSWVTVVDPNYRGGSSYNTQYYPGYLRLYLSDLWSLTRIGRALGLDDVCGTMKGPDDVAWFDSDMY
ncbi:Hypothetical protein PENO1_035320 [Penicillium occitanis (nom. inval.)]|nr:hypothetical protein PENOC_043790 [Penicillium occitanis (nom. inval.)]PCH02885.1 Hypothetical protein PENO1_035320 [Penicillium occitanis (nom. inval.)]